MLIDNVTLDDIQIKLVTKDWQDALRQAAKPMLEKKAIEVSYVDAMIKSHIDNGPYMIITKHICLAHARPDCGVNEMAFTFSTLDPPIEFGAKDLDPVRLIITLAATGENDHIDLMGELAELLTDEQKLDALFEADSREVFYDQLKIG